MSLNKWSFSLFLFFFSLQNLYLPGDQKFSRLAVSGQSAADYRDEAEIQSISSKLGETIWRIGANISLSQTRQKQAE